MTSNDNMQSDLPKSIGRPATEALHHVGIYRLEQLREKTEKEILGLHGVGPKAMRMLKQALEEKGWGFKA